MTIYNKKSNINLLKSRLGIRRSLFNYAILFLMANSFLFLNSCKKLVQIPPPVNSITTTQVFADSADATDALMGIYSNLIDQSNGQMLFGDGGLTIYTGLSSDELISFQSYSTISEFQLNQLQGSNSTVYSMFWTQPYGYIYQANAILNGLSASATISNSVKSETISEATFLRDYMYFYLVNLFGDVPFLTSINWQSTQSSARTPKNAIYNQIKADLIQAISILPSDYSNASGERIRVTKWAAMALLSRVYIYTGIYDSAALEASNIIANASLFSLAPTPNGVFLANSSESILQLKLNTSFDPYTATPEGANLIPASVGGQPSFYVTSQLLASFEPGDLRQAQWIDSGAYNGTTYYYPYKYQTGLAVSSTQVNGTATQYYTVLRLAEQVLIRAEAEAQLGQLAGAINDINIIRNRAGLLPVPSTLDQAGVLAAVAQERKIELFCEWGNRWLDLIRTNQATTVLSNDKGYSVGSDMLLYPIPMTELLYDPNLRQNPGYN